MEDRSPKGSLGWQPIETAPKDGSWLLGYDRDAETYGGKTHKVIRWKGGWWTQWSEHDGVCNATHWMPLPQSPRDPVVSKVVARLYSSEREA